MACSNPRTPLALSLIAGLATALAWPSSTAQACGGTFCDNTGQVMPVDQTGEDILFVRDGTDIEAHVRIQYDGEAERFAWLVPLQAIPDVSVGSDALFAHLSQQTAPVWRATTSYECPEEDPSWGDDGGTDGGSEDGGETGGGGPMIVLQETVGAFDVVVLQGGTAQEVVDFLDANDYAQEEGAEPILQQYLDEGFLIAAVRLTAGADVDEIHPLNFRFQGDEPCVPLRLTAVAAMEDMGVRAYFLDSARWVPTNYAHVVLNPLAYRWSAGNLSRYIELLAIAADEAGGRAFATDYAGDTPSSTPLIYNSAWDETAFLEADPITAVELIVDQGLNTHPMVRALLAEYIPPPDGVDANDFWSNIDFYADQVDLDAWDDVAFSEALAERVIVPGMHAEDLLETWPYLTRLHTTISPNEMTEDPTFHVNADLPEVPRTVLTSSLIQCGGDRLFDVDFEASADQGGQQVVQICQPAGTAYPDFPDMPRALRVEQIPAMGPPQVVADNSETILAIHAEQQLGQVCESDEGGGTEGTGGGTGSDEGGSEGGTGAEGGSGTGGGEEVGDDGTGTGAGLDDEASASCGCSSDGQDHSPLGVALGLLVLGLVGGGPFAGRRRFG